MQKGDVVGSKRYDSSVAQLFFYCPLHSLGGDEKVRALDEYAFEPACKECGEKLLAISVVKWQRATDRLGPDPIVEKTPAAMTDEHASLESQRDTLFRVLESISRRTIGGSIPASETLEIVIKQAGAAIRICKSRGQGHGLGLIATRERAAALGRRVTVLEEHNKRLLDAVGEGIEVIEHYVSFAPGDDNQTDIAVLEMLRLVQDPTEVPSSN